MRVDVSLERPAQIRALHVHSFIIGLRKLFELLS